MSAAADFRHGRNRQARRRVAKLLRRIARDAGVNPARVRGPCVAPSPWKHDDAEWFRAHPDRAHRMRPRFAGETDLAIAPGAEIDMVAVRQVRPGVRVRQAFRWRACEPDFIGFMQELTVMSETDESIAHALFDLPVNDNNEPTSIDDLLTMIDRYAASAMRQ